MKILLSRLHPLIFLFFALSCAYAPASEKIESPKDPNALSFQSSAVAFNGSGPLNLTGRLKKPEGEMSRPRPKLP